jgi:hypothetical protein
MRAHENEQDQVRLCVRNRENCLAQTIGVPIRTAIAGRRSLNQIALYLEGEWL